MIMGKRNIRILVVLSLFLTMGWASLAYAGQYVIGDDDMLSISVWKEPELSVNVPVRPDGMISVPLLGDVKAAGKTPQQLKTLLESMYARYTEAPVVSVIVTKVNSFVVYVFGGGISQQPAGSAASSPQTGVFVFKRNTTLLQLLSRLGSLGNADLKKSAVIRNGKKLNADFYRLFIKGDVTQDVMLEPGDFIYIPSNFGTAIRVVGAVKKPGIFPYEEHMTVLDAVLTAGGFTDYASQNDVFVERKEGGKIISIRVLLKEVMNGDVKENVSLDPGDMVIVKSGIF